MRRDTGSSSSTSPTFPCKRYEKCSCATQHRREQPKPRSSRLPGGVGGGGLGYGLAGQVHRCLDFAALSRGAAAEIRPAGGGRRSRRGHASVRQDGCAAAVRQLLPAGGGLDAGLFWRTGVWPRAAGLGREGDTSRRAGSRSRTVAT